jgi:hypothetical protein
MMSVLALPSLALRPIKAFSLLPALALLSCVSLVIALETPSKPFLDKNSFYLSSAGFRVQLANDAAGKKALHALPPHRFVTHTVAGRHVISTPSRSIAPVCSWARSRLTTPIATC